jgi:hypothetical protein
VIQEPFTACSRCHRLKLSCRIQENFKRVGKRSRNAEMEREIVELRRQIAEQVLPGSRPTDLHSEPFASADQYGSNEAVEGLMGLSGGLGALKRIEDVLVTQECILELFNTQVPEESLPLHFVPGLNLFDLGSSPYIIHFSHF